MDVVPVVVSAIVSLIVGFALAEFSESRRDKRQRKRDAQARREEREATSAQLRADFQLRSLIELQEAMAHLVEAGGSLHGARVVAQWNNPLGRQLDYPTTPDAVPAAPAFEEAMRDAAARVTYLSARVDSVDPGNFARLVQHYVEELAFNCASEKKGHDHLREARKVYVEANMKIREEIRRLWDLDAVPP